jgi:hypothetical protein
MNPERRGLLNLATTSGAGELTEDEFFRMIEQVQRDGPAPHSHIISPRAEPGTIVLCGDCGGPVRVPDVWP